MRCHRLTLCASLFAMLLAGCDGDSPSVEHAARAEALRSEGKLIAAMLQYRSALAEDPDNPTLRSGYGHVTLALGFGRDAEEAFRRAIAEGERTPELTAGLIAARFAHGDYKGGLEALDRHGATLPEAQRQVLRARGLAGTGRPQEAVDLLAKVIEADPENAPAMRNLGRMLMVSRKFDQARDLLERAVAADPDDPVSWLTLGRLRLGQARLEGAREALERAVALAPDSSSARLELAAVSLAQNEPERARDEIQAINEFFPRTPRHLHLLALAHIDAGDEDTGSRLLQDALKLNPRFAPSLTASGMLYIRRKRTDLGREFLHRALQADPFQLPSRVFLALSYLRGGEPLRTIKLIEPAIRVYPDVTPLRNLLVTAYIAAGDPEKAITTIRNIAEQTGAKPVETSMASLYLAAGLPDRAVELLRASAPEDGDAAPDMARDLVLAYALARSGDQDAGIERAREVVASYPDQALAHHVLGLTYEGAERLDDARNAFERAVEIDPDFVAARTRLIELGLRDGDLAAAEQGYLALQEASPRNADVLLGRAKLALMRGDAATSLSLLDQARALSDSHVESRLILSSHHLALGDADTALAVAREALEAAPGNAAAALAAARAHAMRGELARARALLEPVLDRPAPPTQVYLTLGLVELRAGQRANARRHLQKALEEAPDSTEAIIALAQLEVLDGRFESGLAQAEELIARGALGPVVRELRGDALAGLGRSGEAETDYRAALAEAPDAELVLKLASTVIRQGGGERGFRIMREWIAANPDDRLVRVALASLLDAGGRTEEARRLYLEALDADADFPPALNNLALLELERDPEAAVALAARLAAIADDSAKLLDTAGWIYTQAGEVEQGVKLLRRAEANAPGNPNVALHLATALLKLGDANGARSLLERIDLDDLDPQTAGQARVLMTQLQLSR